MSTDGFEKAGLSECELGLGVSNRGLEDQLSKLLKDTDLQIKEVIVVIKVVRD